MPTTAATAHAPRTWWIRIFGDFACWTLPQLRSERTSAIVPSHEALVGVLRSALFGKKEYRWTVHDVRLLRMPGTATLTASELKFDAVDNDGTRILYADGQRTLRDTTFLTSPDYLVRASIARSPLADPEDTIEKADAMIRARGEAGARRRPLVLGTRDCMGHYRLLSYEQAKLLTVVDYSQDLGIMPFGIDWDDPSAPYYFAPMRIEHGVLVYPSWDEVRRLGIARPSGRAA